MLLALFVPFDPPRRRCLQRSAVGPTPSDGQNSTAIQDSKPTQQQVEVHRSQKKVDDYMFDKRIVFRAGSWNLADYDSNQPILNNLANILRENPTVSLRLHGVQKGKSSAHTDAAFNADFSTIPWEPATAALGRVLACKQVLVDLGIKGTRLTVSAKIDTLREVTFIVE